MKRLICGCHVAEAEDALVKVGAVGIGHRMEQCDKCKPPPASATHYSAENDRWIQFTQSGKCRALMNGCWIELKSNPGNLIPKIGRPVSD